MQAFVHHLFTVIAIFISTVVQVDGLKCYTCVNITDPTTCQHFVDCSNDQACSHSSSGIPRIQFHEMGCTDNQLCETWSETASTLVGRSAMKRQGYTCQQCCSTDLCNMGLCSNNTNDFTENPIRLVGGTDSSEGRVEIFHDNEWGTICDDGISHSFAVVACRQLGYDTSNVGTRSSAYFGQGSGRIWKDNVVCTGSEIFIDNCTSQEWGITDCGHKEDVGVICHVSSLKIRLVDGGTPNEGRVEVFYNNTWGTMCDDGFGTEEAGVVCNMLGFPREGAEVRTDAYFGEGTGPIILDDVSCDGTERNVQECVLQVFGVNNCVHREDVGVVCSAGHVTEQSFVLPFSEEITANPNTFLLDGFLLFTDSFLSKIFRMDLVSTSYSSIPVSAVSNPVAIDYDYIGSQMYWTDVGLQQIRSANLDGTNERIVCNLSTLLFFTDTGLDTINVMPLDGNRHLVIIDSDLGEPRAIVAVPELLKIYWTDWGSTPKIETSDYDGNNRLTLISTGLEWPNAIAIDIPGDLIYWADGGSGKVERARLSTGGERQLIQDDSSTHYFGLTIVGSSLYYTDWAQDSVMTIHTSGGMASHFGPEDFSRPMDIHVYVNGMTSSGHNACSNGGGGCSFICIPTSTEGRKCLCPEGRWLNSDGVTCDMGSIRLVGGSTIYEGRLEVLYNGTWGTVCDDSFTDTAAVVVCSMLHLPNSSARAITALHWSFDSTPSQIWLDNVHCTGSETILEDCSYNPWGQNDCTHDEDVGVVCSSL